MAGDQIYYEKDGGEFVLVHQLFDLDGFDLYGLAPSGSNKEVLYRGQEVAIGFTYDPDEERNIQYTTHRHGSPEDVEEWAEKTRFALQRSRFTSAAITEGENAAALLRSMQPHTISSDQWDIDDLNAIISTTGYLRVVLEKMGIKLG